MDEPGLLWDQLAVCAPGKKDGTTILFARSATSKLRLVQEPKVKHLPDLARTVASIHADLRKAIREVVSGNEPWPLFVFGPAGTGKTCAALCLLDHSGGEYFAVSDLCERLILADKGRLEETSGSDWHKVLPEKIWRRIAEAPLFVLDEIGCRDAVSDFHYEAVKRSLDRRHGKPAVYLSNLGLEDLERLYDQRVTSRMGSGTVLELGGKDRRLAR